MKLLFRDSIKPAAILILYLVMGFGCSASPLPQTGGNNSLVNLTARNATVMLIRGETPQEVEAAAVVDLNVNEIVELDATGQGEIQFLDRIKVGLHQATEVHMVEARQGSDNSVSLNLYQGLGNAHVTVSDQPNTWITLRTEYATITNLEEDSEFVICHKPDGVTCGYVFKGLVAFVAQGERQIAGGGEAIYVLPGQPPSAPICGREPEVLDWMRKVQTSEPAGGLGAIVASWPQEPCASPGQATPTVEVANLPSPEGMVRIEAGDYTVGVPNGDDFHASQREIRLNPYWIDQFEVTNAQYQEFLNATGNQPPATWPGEEDHPVAGVTWQDSAAYCTWANKRLPTEAEWEAAARGPGPDPGLHPWGNDPLAGGQVNQLPLERTYPAGAYDFNQSPFGVYDLSGNVWEWVGEPYESIPEGTYVLRGGRFGFLRDAAYRQAAIPEHERFVPYAGFRCAADQVQGE